MRYKKLLLVLITVILSLGAGEIILRLIGYKPGTFKKLQGFDLVDSLQVYKNFTTDETGIYKFSPWVSDSLQLYFDCKSGKLINPNVAQNLHPVDHLDYILQSFCRLADSTAANGIVWRLRRWAEHESETSEFATAYKSALQQKPDTADEWASALIDYVHHPFNREGFRSIAYKPYQSKRKKVLLIGDSFVYGMTARPFYNCFADILLARGYIVYSAGIPGTDPAQYTAIVQKYVPVLKPDIVLVCFYEGNDYMRFARVPSFNEPHEHITNAGFFSSVPLGAYLNPDQSYAYYKSLVSIPDVANSKFNSYCAHSSLSGLLWGALYKLNCVSHPALAFYDSVEQHTFPDTAFTASRIHLIDSTCRAQNTPLKIIVIPQFDAWYNKGKDYLTIDKKMADQVIGNGSWYSPVNLVAKSDFPNDNYHFNNAGSTKFANFVDSLLRQTSWHD